MFCKKYLLTNERSEVWVVRLWVSWKDCEVCNITSSIERFLKPVSILIPDTMSGDMFDGIGEKFARPEASIREISATLQVMHEALAAIDPSLVIKYDICPHSCGVQLIRRGDAVSSIVSMAGKAGFYEIYPDMYGIGLRKRFERFGIDDNVISNLTFREAVAIAEAAGKGGLELEALVRRHMYVDVPKAS